MNDINEKLIRLIDIIVYAIKIIIFIISIPLTIIVAFALAALVIGAMMAIIVGLLYLMANI